MSITSAQFDEHFDPVVKDKQPRGWDNERKALYFSKMRGWDIVDLTRVCNWMITERDRKDGMTAFPQISEFFSVRRKLENQQRERMRSSAKQEGTEELVSCQHCRGGRIWFDKMARGASYEHVAVCDCNSGTLVAEHHCQMAKLKHRRGVTMESVRYSYIFATEGGLATADHGRGLMHEPPGKSLAPEQIAEMAGIQRETATPEPKRWSGNDDDPLPF